MKSVAAILAFWAVCALGAAALSAAAFVTPDSRASPAVPVFFLVITALFARAALAIWHGRPTAARRIYQTTAVFPLFGAIAWLVHGTRQLGAPLLALVLGLVLYSVCARAVAHRVARRFPSVSPAS
jgi:hypothetical protein